MNALPKPSPFAAHWQLDPEVVFLNHGSFGACPRPVLERQSELRRELEAEPVRFLARQLEAKLDEAREALARLVGCAHDDLGFVPNATAGVNTVLRSLEFAPGDELLTTDHEYDASRNALDFVAQRSGARVVTAPLPFPLQDPAEVLESLLQRCTDRTKLCLIDHVTSPTGLVLPIEPVVRALSTRGIDVLVDGAHAPGMLPLALDRLGAAYYTGNCHKWLCAPKGAAFLHVRRDRQAKIRPLSISHGAGSLRRDRSRFRLEFDFTGTADYSPFLCLPAAIEFLQGLLPGGLAALQAHNRDLALAGRELLCAAIATPPPAPAAMLGSLASVLLPPIAGTADALQQRLFDLHRIEVPVVRWPDPPLRLLRISPQIYNSVAQYEYLARAVAAELGRAGAG